MPIFEYICKKCGKKFEVLEKSSDGGGKINCPDCSSPEIEKQISVFNAVVKEGQSKKCHSCSDMSCPHSSH
jgi:putative FmdB family regulatory protein